MTDDERLVRDRLGDLRAIADPTDEIWQSITDRAASPELTAAGPSRHRTPWFAAAAALLLLAGGAAVLRSGEGTSTEPVRTAGEAASTTSPQSIPPEPAPADDGLSADQRAAIEAVRSGGPSPVLDSGSGEFRGFVSNAAVDARDDRVVATIVDGFREPIGSQDAEYDRLFEALRILDPVVVTDEDGRTVGYWTGEFREIDELAELTPGALDTVEELLG